MLYCIYTTSTGQDNSKASMYLAEISVGAPHLQQRKPAVHSNVTHKQFPILVN